MDIVYSNVYSNRRLALLGMPLLLGIPWVGCSSSPPTIRPAAVDMEKATQIAFAQCDTDSDGAISKAETVAFPAIGRRFTLFDQDRDGKVTIEEFKQMLTDILDPSMALVSVSCVVTQKGKPLTGAIVRFVPEEFFGGAIPSAEGVVNGQGSVLLSIKAEDLPAGAPNVTGFIRPGLYRVVITHPSREIPEKYNLETILGEMVSSQTMRGGPFRFAL